MSVVPYLVPLAMLALGLAFGAWAVSRRKRPLYFGAILGIGGVMVWAILTGRGYQGFDGLGYALLAALVCAPSLLGLLVGGALALWRRRRVGQEALR